MAAVGEMSVEAIEFEADGLDVKRAAAVYREQGALVIRGLFKDYVEAIRSDILAAAADAVAMLDRAEKINEGWRTPDGTLFIPAPEGFERDKQLMVVACNYLTSSAFFRSAFHQPMVDLCTEILGPDVELFMNGQVLVKEPVGGHAKNLHQDAGYFEHKYEGPLAALTYCVPTNLENGALHVVPGSHRFGMLKHIDTSSHLGLDPHDWPWEKSLPICGEPGDAVLFHVKTIHGSQTNQSDGPRPVFIHRYRAANDYVVIGGTTAANRAKAEAAAAQAKKDNQRGFMVAGTRRYEDRV